MKKNKKSRGYTLKIGLKTCLKYIALIISLGVLFLSGYYNHSQTPGIDRYMKNPGENEGKEIKLSGYVISSKNYYYTIYDATTDYYIVVHNDKIKWQRDDFVAIKGIFSKEGYIEYLFGEVIWDRNIKLAMSFIGLTFVLVLIIIDRKKIIFSW
jgi:hypothetical protein